MDTGNNWNQNTNEQNNNNWNQNTNGQFGGYNSYPMPGAGFINASYICGTLSIATTILCTVYLPYIFGALSIVFAILSRGNAAKMAKDLAERLDHGLKLALQHIEHDAGLALSGFDHNHVLA